jgi:HSP20 family molecular chaperone IbpA
MAQENSNAVQASTRNATTRTAPALMPPVDIFEDASGITLLADLPGVDREHLTIGVDGRQLTIEAPLALGESTSLAPVYTEVRANHFRRSFELSGELDTTAIDAGLRDGVLTLRIPKLERARPRRIEVSVA